MEFERGVFRMHESTLSKPRCAQFLRVTRVLTGGVVAVLSLMFMFYHISFVNKSLIVRGAMED